MRLIIDRICDDLAVCETEEQTFVSVPLTVLPDGAREGSVIRKDRERYVLDPAQEEARRARLFALQNLLFEEEDT